MRKILEQCPTCGEDLIVTEVSCTHCNTVIKSQYQPCPFCHLSADDLRFLEVFVMCRGNVKEMERETGSTYWTIRNRINDIVKTLGYDIDPEEEQHIQEQKRTILQALENGEITVAEAEERLIQLRITGPRS